MDSEQTLVICCRQYPNVTNVDFTTLRIFYLFADCFNLNLTTVMCLLI